MFWQFPPVKNYQKSIKNGPKKTPQKRNNKKPKEHYHLWDHSPLKKTPKMPLLFKQFPINNYQKTPKKTPPKIEKHPENYQKNSQNDTQTKRKENTLNAPKTSTNYNFGYSFQ